MLSMEDDTPEKKCKQNISENRLLTVKILHNVDPGSFEEVTKSHALCSSFINIFLN